MIKCSKYTILALTIILFATSLHAQDKKVWAGVEVIGGDQKTTQQIRALVPIKEGDAFVSSDTINVQSWCNNVKDGVNMKNIQCSLIGYPDGKFYYNVEVSQTPSAQGGYRQIAHDPIHATVPEKLKNLYAQWKQKVNAESISDEYLAANHLQVQTIAKELSKYANKYNSTLLYILRYSPDAQQRSEAAALINWSTHPGNLDFILQWNLLNDPADDVRHHLVKSVAQQANVINDKLLLKKTIHAFCQQTTLPSHDNRNNALFSLQQILFKHQDLIPALHAECRSTISYINKTTVLPTVSGITKDILHLVDNHDKN